MFVTLVFTLYRSWVMQGMALPLYVDESYYWAWAQDLDWGYFSKPPAIAALIALTTSICGDSEYCVRAGSLYLHPITALLIFSIGRRLFGAGVGFGAGLIFLTMPAISLSSMVVSTDVLLLLFWSLSLYLLIEALNSNRKFLWALLGVSVGFGMLSKYSMVLFPVSALLYLSISKQNRHFLVQPGPYVAAVIAFLVFLPNIIWNIQNDFITVAHHAHISNLSHSGLYLVELTEFFLGQFFVFGPVFFCVFGWLLLTCYGKARHFDSVLLLLSFTLLILAVMLAQSFLGRANANWAAPAYVSGSVLVAAVMLGGRKRSLIGAVSVNLMLMGAMYHYYPLLSSLGLELTEQRDPYVRLKGWDEFGEQAIARRNFFPDAAWLARDRDVLSGLSFYTRRLDGVRVYAYNDNGVVDHQFELAADFHDATAKRFIYVSKDIVPTELAAQFTYVEMLPPISYAVTGDAVRTYQLYALSQSPSESQINSEVVY